MKITSTTGGSACSVFFAGSKAKRYKMHVRVLLSRYRAYITCPECRGGRFQPEALNYKICRAHAPRLPPCRARRKRFLTLPEFQGLSISDAR